MGRPNLVGDTLLPSSTILVDGLKDNVARSSTLEVQNQLWKLNQDVLCVRNIPNMGS